MVEPPKNYKAGHGRHLEATTGLSQHPRLAAAARIGCRSPAGVSILHRISGAALFLLLPFAIWMFDTSVTSEVSYARFSSLFVAGVGGLPGWFFKLVAFALIWALHPALLGGLRHLWMDMTHDVGQEFGRQSALFTLVATAVLTLALGYKLFF